LSVTADAGVEEVLWVALITGSGGLAIVTEKWASSDLRLAPEFLQRVLNVVWVEGRVVLGNSSSSEDQSGSDNGGGGEVHFVDGFGYRQISLERVLEVVLLRIWLVD